MELNILIAALCMREYDSQGSKDFAWFLSIINVYLLLCTHTKSFPDLLKNFEECHKPPDRYFEN